MALPSSVLFVALLAASASALSPIFRTKASSACPTFANEWNCTLTDVILLNQGGTVNPDGSVCCPAMSPGCKVQVEAMMGIQYLSISQNKTALKNPDGSGTVSDFTANKEYAVDANGNCQEYCPLNEGTLETLGCGDNSSDVGPTTYNGQKVELYQWNETAFGVIVMETDDFYVDIKDAHNPVPVAQVSHLTPFGQPLGSETQTFANYRTGKQDPKHFQVIGADTCPMSQNCGGSDDDGATQRANLQNGEWFLLSNSRLFWKVYDRKQWE